MCKSSTGNNSIVLFNTQYSLNNRPIKISKTVYMKEY